MIYWVSYFIIKLFSAVLFPFKIVGRENIPSQGGFIFASNHLSYLDPVIVGLCVWRRINYMAKASLFKNKMFAWFLRRVGVFPVHRGKPDIGALREAMRRLKKGSPLLLFPQGTRLEQGKVPQAHSGVGFLIAKSRVPVVPVYIQGSGQVLPPGAKWFKRHPIRVIIGPPLRLSEVSSYEAASRQVMEAILSLSPCC